MSEHNIEKIKIRFSSPDSVGILHDSRKDVKLLAKCCNMLIDKVNELIDQNNKLLEKVKQQ